ncbi:hypothetical protein H5T87_03915 [bacterium]|nr:hypothetical protein [bacterium]
MMEKPFLLTFRAWLKNPGSPKDRELYKDKDKLDNWLRKLARSAINENRIDDKEITEEEGKSLEPSVPNVRKSRSSLGRNLRIFSLMNK